jgi:hypothetical protein
LEAQKFLQNSIDRLRAADTAAGTAGYSECCSGFATPACLQHMGEARLQRTLDHQPTHDIVCHDRLDNVLRRVDTQHYMEFLGLSHY